MNVLPMDHLEKIAVIGRSWDEGYASRIVMGFVKIWAAIYDKAPLLRSYFFVAGHNSIIAIPPPDLSPSIVLALF